MTSATNKSEFFRFSLFTFHYSLFTFIFVLLSSLFSLTHYAYATNKCPAGISITTGAGGQSLCKSATPSAIIATAAFNSGTTNTNMTYTWYYNTTNSTNVSTATQVQTLATTTSTSTNTLTAGNISTSTAGTFYYFCVLTSTSGCSGVSFTTATVLITVYATLTSGTIGSAQTICYNTVPAQMKFTTAPTGGTGAYTYQWYNGSGSISSATNSTYTPAALAGTTSYHCLVTSGSCGTVTSNTITITVPGTLTSGTIGNAQTICYNTVPAQMRFTTAPTGGIGTYTYQWYNGSGSISSATNSTYTPAALTATTNYHCLVTSGSCGTVTSNTITITVNALPSSPTAGNNGPECAGTTLSLTASTVSGATYSWTGPNSYTSSVQNPTVSSSSTTAMVGTYSVTATISGCASLPGTTTATVNPVPANNTGGNQTICIGTGKTIGLTSNGDTYNWSPSTGLSSTTVSNPTANPTVTTTYTLTETIPATGCSATNSMTLTVGTIPVVTISLSWCGNQGQVQLTSNPLTSYLWSTGATTQTIMVDLAGTYKLTATNSFGCSAIDSVQVALEYITNGNFAAGNTGFTTSYHYHPAYYCSSCGDPDTTGLYPENRYAIGTNAHNYHPNFFGEAYTNPGVNNFMIINGNTTPVPLPVWSETINLNPYTTYYFSAYAMSLNNAGNYAQLWFAVNGVQVGATLTLGPGSESTSGPYIWTRFYGTWYSGSATSATLLIEDYQNAAAGNDFGLDNISCSTFSALPLNIAPSGGPFCSGSTLKLYSNVSGGAAPMTYSWAGPNSFTSSAQNPAITNATSGMAGIYYLTVTDSHGCTVNGSADVTTTSIPTVTASVSSSPVCNGSSINLTSSGSSYTGILFYENFNESLNSWTNINNSSGGNPANAAWTTEPANYQYSGTTFNSNDGTQFYLSNSNSQGYGGTTATILQSPLINTMGYSTLSLVFYQYFRYSSGSSAKVDVSTDGMNWTNVASYTSTQGASTSFAQTTINLNSYVGNGTFYIRFNFSVAYNYYWAIDNVALSGTTTNYIYNWSSSPSGFSSSVQNPAGLTPTVNTTYTVSYSYPNNGCSNSKTASVVVYPLPTATISGSTTVCQNASSPYITFTGGTSGATPYTFTYKINSGSNQQITTASGSIVTIAVSMGTAGTYIYTLLSVSDNNGCSQSQSGSATVTINSMANIIIQPDDATVDIGNNTSFSISTNGTGYTYQWQVQTGGTGAFSNITDGGVNPVYSGSKTTTLVLTGVVLAVNTNMYRCIVYPSSPCSGPLTSIAATLTVYQNPTSGLWDGTISTDWNTGGNWDDGYVPNSSTNVIIPSSAPYQPVLSGTPGTCNNLTINPKASLTVDGTLTCGGNILIESDETGTGALMQSNCGNITIVGTITVQAYINGLGYHYLGTSLTSIKCNQVNGFSVSPYNANVYYDPNNPAKSSQFPNMWLMNENHTHNAPADQNCWFAPVPAQIMVPPTGYALNFTNANFPVSITGPGSSLTCGNYQAVVSKETTSTDVAHNNVMLNPDGILDPVNGINYGTGPTNGWHLIANPYTAPLDWDSLVDGGGVGTNINYGITYFKGTTQYTGVYGTYYYNKYIKSNSGSFAPGQYIPVMQAFYIQNGSSGLVNDYPVLTFKNTYCNVSGLAMNGALYRTEENYNGNPIISVRAYKSAESLSNSELLTPNSLLSDKAVIIFNAQNTFAGKLMNTDNNVPNIYVISSESGVGSRKNYLSIYGITELKNEQIVPLGFDVNTDGQYTITAKEISDFPAGTHICLEDMKNNVTQDLTKNPTYTFSINKGDADNRFFLKFNLQSDNLQSAIELFDAYSNENTLIVNYNNPSNTHATLSIFNILGQNIKEFKIQNSKFKIYLGVASGAYMVRLVTNSSVYTKKIYLK